MTRSGVRQVLQDALALHEQGRIAEAAAVYRQIVARDPQNAEALHLLGVAQLQSGNAGQSIALIARAIAIDSRNANYHSNFGLALSRSGRSEEALASFDAALSINPNSANTLNHRGNVLRGLGRPDQALAAYARALAISPGHADALNNRGAVLADLNRTDEALASFGRALAVDPNHAGALCNRGALRVQLKQFEAALADLDRAMALDPENPVVSNNRGNALCGLQRHDEALADFDRAVAINPRYTDAWFNRGSAFSELRRFDEAPADFERALSLEPDRADILIASGQVLQNLKQFDGALQSYNRAIAIKPDDAEALTNRGHLSSEFGQLDQAFADYDRAIAVKPDQELLPGWRAFCKLKMCDWRGIAGDIEQIEQAADQGKIVCSPALMLAMTGSPQRLLQCAESYVQRYFPPRRGGEDQFRSRSGKRIRLGYFSADFHEHATAHLTAGLFEQHDRTQFEITAFSFGPAKKNDMRVRLEKAFDRFVDISGASDAEAAGIARQSGIDIAIDMKAFMEGSRTRIFASRVAPIQVSYLGYPGTMGAGYIDYLIADGTVLPESAQTFYREKVTWLTDSYQPNDSVRSIAANAAERQHFGLPDGAFVFCCFNNNYKITPAVFDIWMRLLARIERSVLWLLEDNPFAARNLRAEAQARGVDADRLIFATRVDRAGHLARHRLADLFLDTLPYNAHTTASDALWAGLPVLTCAGTAFQGRVAASLLRAIGLPELITENPAAYEAAALRLAQSPRELQTLREKLIANRDCQPLFDTAGYTRNLEAAFTRMWERYVSGRPAESFRV